MAMEEYTRDSPIGGQWTSNRVERGCGVARSPGRGIMRSSTLTESFWRGTVVSSLGKNSDSFWSKSDVEKAFNADFRRGKFVNHLTNVYLENSRFVPSRWCPMIIEATPDRCYHANIGF